MILVSYNLNVFHVKTLCCSWRSQKTWTMTWVNCCSSLNRSATDLCFTQWCFTSSAAVSLFEYIIQARSELRFWRGAELDKVKNPKQLYTIVLGKARKFVSFSQYLQKSGILLVRRRQKLRILQNFQRFRSKFKGFLCERRRRERNF